MLACCSKARATATRQLACGAKLQLCVAVDSLVLLVVAQSFSFALSAARDPQEMANVFLSYAREDRAGAEAVAGALSTLGWTVWWDRTIPPGRTFDEVIEEALDQAQCVVVLWSKTSVGSHWVKAEAAEGARRQILVPALLDSARISIEFRRVQAADLTAWHGDPGDPEFRKLIESISTFGLPRAAAGVARSGDVPSAGQDAFDSFDRTTVPNMPPEQPTTRRRSRLIGWLAGAAAVMAMLAAAIVWRTWRDPAPQRVIVPSVVGQAIGDARTALDDVGLAIGRIESRPTDDAPPDRVLEQRPAAAGSVLPGASVDLVVSSMAPVTVPSVIGLQLDQANTRLRSAGLALGTTRVGDAEEPASAGSVIAQRPRLDERVGRGTSVDVVIAGSQSEVPALTGIGLSDARDRLARRALSVGRIDVRPTDAYAPDTVVGQEPAAGSRQPPGTSVSLVIAVEASVAVPPLVGLSLENAQTVLTGAGLQTGTLTKKLGEAFTDSDVVGQAPAPGTRIEKGQRVNLTIAQAGVKVPRIVGVPSRDAADVLKRGRLEPGRSTSRPTTASAPGIVLSQRVPADTLVAIGTSIDFEVASAPASDAATPSRGPATANTITNFRASKRSPSEIVAYVDTFYDGGRGTGRLTLNGSIRGAKGETFFSTGVPLKVGANQVTLPLLNRGGRSFDSVDVRICIVAPVLVAKARPVSFYCQTFPYAYTWSPPVNTVTSFKGTERSSEQLDADVDLVYDGSLGTSGVALDACAMPAGVPAGQKNRVPGIRCGQAPLRVGPNHVTLSMRMANDARYLEIESTQVEVCLLGPGYVQCRAFPFSKRWSR